MDSIHLYEELSLDFYLFKNNLCVNHGNRVFLLNPVCPGHAALVGEPQTCHLPALTEGMCKPQEV
jgi:hypothetical protein